MVPVDPAPHVPWLRWSRNALIALAAGIILFALIGFFVVPPIARTKIEKIATQSLDRQATLTGVDFNPFTLRATLRDFKIADREPGRTLLALDALIVDLSFASLWHRAPVFDAVKLVHPRIDLVRNSDGGYSISDLLAKLATDAGGPPPLFSLNNIEIDDGAVSFDDRPRGKHVAITQLAVGIPFLSSLPYDAQIHVTPRFEGALDGAHFGFAGDSTTPFADARQAMIEINLDGLPLVQYVDYAALPKGVRVKDGALSTRLTLAFETEKGAARAIALSGTARIDRLAIARSDGSNLIAARSIESKIRKLDPLHRSIAVDSLTVDSPDIDLRRLLGGALELEQVAGMSNADGSASRSQASPWTYAIGDARVSNGSLHLVDNAVSPEFRATLTNVAATAHRIASSGAAGTLEVSFDSDEGAHFEGHGDLDIAKHSARGRFGLAKFHVAKLFPYYASALNVDVRQGTVDFDGAFEAASDRGMLRIAVDGNTASLADLDLALRGERDAFWRVPRADFAGIAFDLSKRSITIDDAQVHQANFHVVRDSDGAVNFQHIVRGPQGSKGSEHPSKDADPGWHFVVRKLGVERLSAQFDDRVPEPPVRLTIADAKIAVENIGNVHNAKGKIEVAARIGARGRLHAAGALATDPFAGDWRIRATAIDIASLRPYFERQTNVVVTSGALSAEGRLSFRGAGGATYTGDVAIADFDSLDRPTSQPLLRWRTLALAGVDTATDPFRLSLGDVALDSFFARIIVDPDGTLNLQQLLAPGSAESGASANGGKLESTRVAVKEVPTRRGDLPIAIGRVGITNGEVQFSDSFVKPNYSAHLTSVAGSVSTLSADQSGDVELSAKVENTAPVEIRGKVNPFARELTLDLTANARDVDLPPLTPYSGKYAGYGIQKGKLSLEVHYAVADRKLTATNKLVLDQLTFGEHVDSPTATKLPVLLAVSLLKDRNGVIHLDLPIEGTLDDPKFSVWGVIVQIVVNLVTKAATAPFALLGSFAGGQGEQLAYVEFAPGHSEISSAAEARLRSLAKALADRPGLKVDVAGRAIPDMDRDGLKRASLEQAMRAQKQKTVAAQGMSAPSISDIRIEPSEYSAYLAAVYREASLPDKPRNVLGIAKDIPAADMESLLLANYRVDDEELRVLANRRAQAVKEWFEGPGDVAADRVFVVTPKLVAEGITDKGAPTRVDFALK